VTARTRILGVDYGSIRIGLAVSDPGRKMAFPLETYTRHGRRRDAAYFRELVEREEIGAVVVGLPIHLSGREGQKASEVRAFGQWLRNITGLPVTFTDERFSTVEAEAALWTAGLTHKQRKARRDKLAAQILLQAYLDAGCPDEAILGPLEEGPGGTP
jgi:putative Holliday junction resolvase